MENDFTKTVKGALEQTRIMGMRYYADNAHLASAKIEKEFMVKPVIFTGKATKLTEDSVKLMAKNSEFDDLNGKTYSIACYETNEGGIWLPTTDIYKSCFDKIFIATSKEKKVLVSEDPELNNYIRWLDMMRLGLPPTFPKGYEAVDFVRDLRDITEGMDIVDSTAFSNTTEGIRFYMSFNPVWDYVKKSMKQ